MKLFVQLETVDSLGRDIILTREAKERLRSRIPCYEGPSYLALASVEGRDGGKRTYLVSGFLSSNDSEREKC